MICTDNYNNVIAIILDVLKKTFTGHEIPIGISNRHIHLSRRDLESLFGVGFTSVPQNGNSVWLPFSPVLSMRSNPVATIPNPAAMNIISAQGTHVTVHPSDFTLVGNNNFLRMDFPGLEPVPGITSIMTVVRISNSIPVWLSADL